MDLNADLGEGFGPYRLANEEEIMPLISSASVACGFHAGDPNVMRETVARAMIHHVVVGAHPSYPDLAGFGRREMAATPAEIENFVIYQIGALSAVCHSQGTRLRFVKCHGALYHRAASDQLAARAIARAVKSVDPDLVILGLEGTPLLNEAQALRLEIAREAFVDRAYFPDGLLVPREQPGAILDDPTVVAERAYRMVVDKYVVAIDGTRRIVRPDSLCVHGDGPAAAILLRAVRERLESAGIEIGPFAR